jgi:peptidyl-prolyl cis-trans isomerase C
MKITCALIVFAVALAAKPVVGEDKTVGSAEPAPKTTQQAAAPAVTPAPAHNLDEVVARIGSHEVKRKELDLAVQTVETRLAQGGRSFPQQQIPVLEHQIIDDMINHELILQEGLAHVPPDVDAKVQQQLDRVKSQLGGEEGLTKALQEAGVTPDEYAKRTRENVIIQETMRSVFDREIKVTPEEIKAYYDSNREKMKQPEAVRASHILIRMSPDASEETKAAKLAQIEAARSLIKGGEKFADIARKVSEDPGSASNSGDLGFFTRGQMVPQFEAVAFSLRTNELSDVVTTQYGYHLLMVTDRKPEREATLDEVKGDIEKFLRSTKSTEVAQQHIKGLRDKTKVEVFLKPIEAVPGDSKPGASPSQAPPTAGKPAVTAPKP